MDDINRTTNSRKFIIIAIVASLSAAAVSSGITYGIIMDDSRKRYTNLVEAHYIQEHLEPDELSIARVGQSEESQYLVDGLTSYGAEIQSYPGFEIPDLPPTKDTVYIFERDLMREGMNDPELHEFLRNATEHHSLIVVVGDDGDAVSTLDQALQEADVGPRGSVGNVLAPLALFKLSERVGPINSIYGPVGGSPTYWKDAALTVLETAREEHGHVQLFQ